MSLLIIQQLDSTLQSLSSLITDADVVLRLPNVPASLPAVSTAADKIGRKMATAQNWLDRWVALMASPDPDIRKAEGDIFSAYQVMGKTPADIMDRAADTQMDLDNKMDMIKAAQPSTGAKRSNSPGPRFHLPTLQLPDFDGVDANWPSFWAAFEQAVDKNTSLTDSQKLTYLVGRLKGAARPLVEGFALTDANYPIVVGLLQGRFGDDAKRADRLRSELFHLPKPSASTQSLRSFSEGIERICRQLEGLGTNMDDNAFLTVAIKEKLPLEMRTKLYEKEMESGATWKTKDWRDHLGRAIRLKEAVHQPWEPPAAHPAPPAPKPKAAAPNPPAPIVRSFPVVNPAVGGKGFGDCSLCQHSGHRPFGCPRYNTPALRKARLAEQGRCFMCARDGHRTADCPFPGECRRCRGPHNSLICTQPQGSGGNAEPLGQQGPNRQRQVRFDMNHKPTHSAALVALSPPPTVEFQPTPPDTVDQTVVGSVSHPRSSSFLMVRDVFVYNHRDGHPISTAVFLDTGAQISFISSSLVSVINPQLLGEEVMLVGGFQGDGPSKTMRLQTARYSVQIRRMDGKWETLELNSTEKIIPPVDVLANIRPCPSGVLLTSSVREPHILLGIRDFWPFFLGQAEILPGIHQIDTVFGPFFGGALPAQSSECLAAGRLSVSTPVVVAPGQRPEDLVSQLWSLDSIGIDGSPHENENELAVADFRAKVQLKDGKYEVGWPWRPGQKENLPTNFSLSYSRLKSLSAKFLADSQLAERYQEVILDQLAKGIIEPGEKRGKDEFFLPHHAVINPKKLRVVYDASAKEKGQISLNDALIPGPNLVPELAGVLLRFRATPFPVLGDVEKAFLAVGLRPEDREYAKFLWLKNPRAPLSPQNLVIFRFTRVAFGVNSSPFLLASVLQHHLESIGDPLHMKENFYVDNLLLCNENAEEAVAAIRTARQIMAQAGMRLREFVAADPKALVELGPGDMLKGPVQKVLGVNWNLEDGNLEFEMPAMGQFPPTRRGVLGAVASLFDPLGLCSPCLLRPKMFFQSLWDLVQGWDTELSPPLRAIWADLVAELEGGCLSFPRLTPCSGCQLQLHVFSDAGPNAYAAAIYLRAEADGKVYTSLMFAKSRLRPKNMKVGDGLTIPRLELLGLVIAVRAKRFIMANFPQPQLSYRHSPGVLCQPLALAVFRSPLSPSPTSWPSFPPSSKVAAPSASAEGSNIHTQVLAGVNHHLVRGEEGRERERGTGGPSP